MLVRLARLNPLCRFTLSFEEDTRESILNCAEQSGQMGLSAAILAQALQKHSLHGWQIRVALTVV